MLLEENIAKYDQLGYLTEHISSSNKMHTSGYDNVSLQKSELLTHKLKHNA